MRGQVGTLQSETICALVPVAGLSSRMGAFKPLLPLRGRSVIEETVSSALRGGASVTVVVTGHRAEDVERALSRSFGPRVIFVRNPEPATTDMMRSVQLGAAGLPACGAFFLLPGDMPAVSQETFARLLEMRERVHAPVIFPTFEGRRGHPPLVDAGTIPEISAHEGEGGLRGLWARLEDRTVDVPVDDAGVCVDLDTRDDLRRCAMMI